MKDERKIERTTMFISSLFTFQPDCSEKTLALESERTPSQS